MQGLLEVDLPADARSLRAARLVALDAAERGGLDCDAADDLQLALDEVCFAVLVHVVPGDRIALRVRNGDGVQIEGTARLARGGEGFALGNFARTLLALVLDECDIVTTRSGVEFVLQKRARMVLDHR